MTKPPPAACRLVAAVALGLAASAAAHADALFCPAPDLLFDPRFDLDGLESGDIADNALRFESGNGSIEFGGQSLFEDGVLIRRGDDYLAADRAEYDPSIGRIALTGDVQYSGLASSVRGQSAEFDYGIGAVRFSEAEFLVPDGGGHGEAGALEIDRQGQIRLDRVAYTSCPAGEDDWMIRAGSIRLDAPNGIGTARNLRLEFQGVPILYAPYLSFPMTDARKSGILTPEFGTSGRNGTEIGVPYYWNIAPNYDATLTPRILSRRGIQLQTEFRYLTGTTDGVADVEYLPNDNEFGDTRTYVKWRNRTFLPDDWRLRIDAEDVTDINYFEDLGDSQSEASTTFLNRSLIIDRYGEHWDFLIRAQALQILDPELTAPDRPYRRLPEFAANGRWPGQWLGAEALFESSLVRFERDVGVTGWRAHGRPALRLPLNYFGAFITPEIAWNFTRYKLSDTDPGADDSPTRALPSFSLDAGAVFERELPNSAGWIQTLEPRILYVHTPHRDQSDLPVFDTIEPDFNLVQIFRNRPLIGLDRILDVDQISFGLTSRIIQAQTGKALVSATIGQTRYLSQQGVSLPGGTPRTGEFSDYIAEIGVNLSERWNLDFGHQWNTDLKETIKSEVRLQYQPAPDRVLNLAYRFRRDSIEQGDLSWSWPIARRWNFVGRYNYSLREDTTLERFVGFEYESCCWAARLVSRRYISRRDGTSNSSVAIQLELKGLASVGDPADKRLERGILGYRSRQDD